MAESRTTKQIAADRLDLEVFRVVGSLDRFANDHRDETIREMAALIDSMRYRVRKHMHRNDQGRTT